MTSGSHGEGCPGADRDATTVRDGAVVVSAGGASGTAVAPGSPFTLLGDPGAAACEGDGCALPV